MKTKRLNSQRTTSSRKPQIQACKSNGINIRPKHARCFRQQCNRDGSESRTEACHFYPFFNYEIASISAKIIYCWCYQFNQSRVNSINCLIRLRRIDYLPEFLQIFVSPPFYRSRIQIFTECVFECLEWSSLLATPSKSQINKLGESWHCVRQWRMGKRQPVAKRPPGISFYLCPPNDSDTRVTGK